MKPEMWREFFKEPYRRFYGYIRERGVIAIHHADSYLVPIVEDNGLGFDAALANDPRATLANIRQRLEMMCGGTLEIAPREGGGAVVRVTIPEQE